MTANNKLSTSALAKSLELPPHKLFTALQNYGWIKKSDDGWLLSNKGEFEGGEYNQSKRYGRYIVWPDSIKDHRIIIDLQNHRMETAAMIGRTFDFSPREVNRIFAEMGWLKRCAQGWQLSSNGEAAGGVQMENEQSGMLYAVWPKAIVDNPLFKQQFSLCKSLCAHNDGADLVDIAEQSCVGLDGHQHQDRAQLEICQCLYLMGLVHACQRLIPGSDMLCSDFFLPEQQLYIDYMDEAKVSPKTLLDKQQLYDALSADRIEILPADLSRLDDVLAKHLRKYGVHVL